MRDFQSSFLVAASMSLVLLGAGCSGTASITPSASPTTTKTTQPVSVTTTTTVTEPAKTPSLSCPSGTTPFVATKLNVEFCYPTVDDGGNAITVKEGPSNIALSVGGSTTRIVGVVTIPNGQGVNTFITSTYMTSKVPVNTKCSLDANTRIIGRTSYRISGETDGNQDLEGTDLCTQNTSLKALFGGFAVGEFFFSHASPSTLFFISGEQDPSLGATHTGEFEDSIQPKM